METQTFLVFWIIVFLSTVQIKAVSVNPDPYLCPTNKIAPHRRILRSSRDSQPRTFGAYYDLLTPSFNQQQALSDDDALQEEPQQDDPDDCGDIDDYDENDLSSLTSSPQQQRRGFNDGRFFFGGVRPPSAPEAPVRPPPNYPPRPPQGSYPVPRPPPQGGYPVPRPPPQGGYPVPRPPPQGGYPIPRPPQGNYPAQRPPYWSGGHFGNKPYQPPADYYPSDNIKPVYEEGINDPPEIYRPDLVGGPSHTVVGASPAPFRPPRPRPTRPNNNPNRDRISATQAQSSPNSYDYQFTTTTQRPQSSSNYDRYTTKTNRHTTRRPRPRKLNNDDSIIGSFIDLLF